MFMNKRMCRTLIDNCEYLLTLLYNFPQNKLNAFSIGRVLQLITTTRGFKFTKWAASFKEISFKIGFRDFNKRDIKSHNAEEHTHSRPMTIATQ